MTNPNSEEIYSKTMFMMAMHFLYKKRQDQNIVVPDSIPVEMIFSLTGKLPPNIMPPQM
jgi:hypothetical protein